MLYLLFPMIFPMIPFICIILILEIDLSGGIDGFRRSIVKMIKKHFLGFIIVLFYYYYTISWAEYHAGHYPVASVQEFMLFPLLDRSSNFIATLGIFYFIYGSIFLYLNKYWFNQE